MSLIYIGNPLSGDANDNFILNLDGNGTPNTIFGGDGDDYLLGGISNFWLAGAAGTAPGGGSILTSLPSAWSVDANPDVADATTIPHTTVYNSAIAGTTAWYQVTVVAGQTITLDIDYGNADVGVAADMELQLWDPTGTTVLAANDDNGGDPGSTSSLDPGLTYTFSSAGTYLIQVGTYLPGNGLDTFSGGEEYLLHVSLTGQTATGAELGTGDAFSGGIGNDTIYGMGGNDLINGDADDDILDGGAGSDTVNGGTGLDWLIDRDGVNGDTYDGGADDDLLDYFESAFADFTVTYDFTSGIVSQFGNAFTDTFSGIEILFASDAAETIISDGSGQYYAFGGDDYVFAGNAALDEGLDGGDGDDTLDTTSFGGNYVVNLATGATNFAYEAFTNFENLITGIGNDTLTGTTGVNGFDGGAGIDQFHGDAGDDTIFVSLVSDGGAGEVYDGGADTDTLSLGNNGDTYVHDLRDDTLLSIERLIFQDPGFNEFATIQLGASQLGSGLSSTGTVEASGYSDVTHRLEFTMGSVTTLSLANLTFVDFTGVNGNPDNRVVVYGDGSSETITGSSAIDELWGAAGNDTFFVANGDIVRELVGGGNDTVRVLGGAFTLSAGNEVETLATSNQSATNAVTIVGNEFGQQLLGNNGANILVGGGGIDSFAGFLGNDIYVVDNAAETITELAGQGTDYVYTTVSYTLAAGVSIENLTASPLASTNAINLTGNELGQVIVGNNGVNTNYGGAGNDSIYGYGGNDYLEGAQGNDSLFGGTGVDRFVFRESLGAASGIDRIYDMTASDNIVIDALAVSSLTSLTANQFRLGTAAGDADDRIIYDATSGVFWFDPDGTGAQAAILFGVIDGAPGGVDHTWFELM